MKLKADKRKRKLKQIKEKGKAMPQNTTRSADQISSKREAAILVLEFQEAGWMSAGTAKIYESILKREDLLGFEASQKRP